MKNLLLPAFLIFFQFLAHSQEKLFFYGGIESNSQLLLDDGKLNFRAPSDNFRSNNYFSFNFNYGKFSGGLQYETYLPSPLLGYDPLLEGNEIGTFYIKYRTEVVEATAGHFYEQFGSGLIYRSWEDRQLGINNALRGLRVILSPLEAVEVKLIYGQQRKGFELSEGVIGGIDADFDLSQLFNFEGADWSIGGSFVNRYQDNSQLDEVPSSVAAVAARTSFNYGRFFSEIEAVFKQPDVLVYSGSITNDRETFEGSAWLVNFGYALEGFGLNTSFRRLENFSFYSERLAEGNQYNRLLINYVPALTKQHDYLLNNLYVYSAQPRLLMQSAQRQAGEIGFQADLYYSIPKETFLGGKYGAKLEVNYAHWSGLDAEFDLVNNSYSSAFLGLGENYFSEIGVGVRKRWSLRWSGIYSFTYTQIDKGVTVGSPLGFDNIEAAVGILENTYRLGKGRSLRLELQHLWTQQDRENWAAGVLEYNFNPAFGIFLLDSWNYGGEGVHYYNFGGSYIRGSSRLAVNYGRQRGGLICVGGVCRFVPENTGININLSMTF